MIDSITISPTEDAEVPQDGGALSDDMGEDRRGHKPRERRCVVSGEARDPYDMVRFVRSPDGVVTPDIAGKLPGRGVWVSADRDSLDQAVATKAFARGFKSKTIVPDDLTDQVEQLLLRRVLSVLSMAHKAGKLAIGFDQVKGAAGAQALSFRIEAKDGSSDGRSKIRTIAKAVARDMEIALPKVIGCFSAAELGAALRRESVVHVALTQGGFAKTLALAVRQVSGFRPLIPEDWPDRVHELDENNRGIARD